MRILIGGSPSTGSSVLRQVINRHPALFCGPETNLFCYPALYENWTAARKRLLRRGLLGLYHTDIRHLRGVHLVDAEFAWNPREIRELVLQSHTFHEFCDAFFDRPLLRNAKSVWAEKTPANILQWHRFSQVFDDALIVHMIRSPYDTVCSLMHRGMSLYQAAAVWLVYTAHGMSAIQHPGYVEVRYEKFTQDPAVALEKSLLHRLHLTFAREMLSTGNPDMSTPGQMQGWRSDEREAVSTQSVGRFFEEPIHTQHRIAHAVVSVKITDAYAAAHNLAYTTIQDICQVLNYPVVDVDRQVNAQQVTSLHNQRRLVIRQLCLRGAVMPWQHPVQLIGVD